MQRIAIKSKSKTGPWATTSRHWLLREVALCYRNPVNVESVLPHRIYRARIEQLAPGEEFSYRVKQNGKTVFFSDRASPTATLRISSLCHHGRLRHRQRRAKTCRLSGLPGESRLSGRPGRYCLLERAEGGTLICTALSKPTILTHGKTLR